METTCRQCLDVDIRYSKRSDQTLSIHKHPGMINRQGDPYITWTGSRSSGPRLWVTLEHSVDATANLKDETGTLETEFRKETDEADIDTTCAALFREGLLVTEDLISSYLKAAGWKQSRSEQEAREGAV